MGRERSLSGRWMLDDINDTREIDDNWKPIQGTGEYRNCDNCGKPHEIHCAIHQGDRFAVVGTSCAKLLAPQSVYRLTTKALQKAAEMTGRRIAATKQATRAIQ